MMTLLVGATTALAQAPSASFQRIGVPPGFEHCEAVGVSTNGVVVGKAYRFDPWDQQAFRWTASAGFELLPVTTGQSTGFAVGISDDGQSVLGRVLGFGSGLGVIWRGGETFVLGLLPGLTIDQVGAISGDGQIVVGSIRDGSFVRRGMRWNAAGMPLPMSDFPVEPGEISDIRATVTNLDGSVVAGKGWMDPGPWFHAFRWTDTEEGYLMLGVIPGYPETQATDVSDDGSIIVGFGNQGFHQTAFRWTTTTGFDELGYLPGGSSASIATGVSGDGSVIVGRSGVIQPFIWDELNGMRNLREVAADLLGHDPTTGLTTMRPEAISADGSTIVGYGENESGKFEAWILTLPGHGSCYADCDASGELDFFDFLCYQNLFGAGDPEADCDETGELDFFDFLCFQNAFAAGCP